MKKIGIVCVFSVLLIMAGCKTSDIDECENLIKNDLKSPASAQFSEIEYKKNNFGDMVIMGVVDSQNSFGAMLRSEFACYKDDGYSKINNKLKYLLKDEDPDFFNFLQRLLKEDKYNYTSEITSRDIVYINSNEDKNNCSGTTKYTSFWFGNLGNINELYLFEKNIETIENCKYIYRVDYSSKQLSSLYNTYIKDGLILKTGDSIGVLSSDLVKLSEEEINNISAGGERVK